MEKEKIKEITKNFFSSFRLLHFQDDEKFKEEIEFSFKEKNNNLFIDIREFILRNNQNLYNECSFIESYIIELSKEYIKNYNL